MTSFSKALIINFLIITIFLFISSCDFNIDKVDRPVDIAKMPFRSKELGLFIQEYNSISIKINDTIQFEIVKAWVEYNFYYSDLSKNFYSEKDWYKKTDWKLKKDFNPINGAHLSFLIKGDFVKKYKAYDDNWKFYYCQHIESEDTSINNGFTYFESYGPSNYINCPDSIEIKFEQYIPSEDSTKYGRWFEFGKFYLKTK